MSENSKITIKAGDRVPYKRGTLKIMAIAEGYAMVRYPRAMVFCLPVKELERFRDEFPTQAEQPIEAKGEVANG